MYMKFCIDGRVYRGLNITKIKMSQKRQPLLEYSSKTNRCDCFKRFNQQLGQLQAKLRQAQQQVVEQKRMSQKLTKIYQTQIDSLRKQLESSLGAVVSSSVHRAYARGETNQPQNFSISNYKSKNYKKDGSLDKCDKKIEEADCILSKYDSILKESDKKLSNKKNISQLRRMSNPFIPTNLNPEAYYNSAQRKPSLRNYL